MTGPLNCRSSESHWGWLDWTDSHCTQTDFQVKQPHKTMVISSETFSSLPPAHKNENKKSHRNMTKYHSYLVTHPAITHTHKVHKLWWMGPRVITNPLLHTVSVSSDVVRHVFFHTYERFFVHICICGHGVGSVITQIKSAYAAS